MRIGYDDRTNSILVAGSRNDLDVVEAIVSRLEDYDVAVRRLETYRLKNAQAPDVAALLTTYVTNMKTVIQPRPPS